MRRGKIGEESWARVRVGDLNGVVSSGGEDAGERPHTAGTRRGPHWPADGSEE